MQHAAAQAYTRTTQTTAAPRELEAHLLLKAAAKLQAVKDGVLTGAEETVAAIRYNRRLWTVLSTSITSPENPLPQPLKQNLANLGLFVMKQSMAMEIDPADAGLGVLISINREIAAGLSAQPV